MCTQGTNVCTGVAIEHLTISGADTSGGNTFYNAIYNNFAQQASYVDDVVFLNVGQLSNSPPNTQPNPTTGLYIGEGDMQGTPGGWKSGPYTNLGFKASTPGGVCGSGCPGSSGLCACQPTACVQIRAQTRGLHGMTCAAASVAGGSQPKAAVYVDSYNNTVDDVHVEGFYDAIVIGDNPANGAPNNGPNATGNTISNITSADGAGPVTNTVHICNPTTVSQNTACQGVAGIVGDVTVLQAQSTGPSVPGPPPAFLAKTIQDDLTQTTINSSASPAFVGMYILGEQTVTNGNVFGYSRFTTSPGPGISSSTVTPNWAVGGVSLPTSTGCSNPGAIYSNTSGTAGSTFWVCSGGVWKPIG